MFNAVLAIALKDLKLLFRDKTSAFFTFGFPLALAVFFGMVFGGAGGGNGGSPAKLALVDESGGGKLAKSFTADLDADPLIEVIPVKDRTEGESLVREGKALACVILPPSFDGGAMSMFAGGGLTVEALVDPSRKAETGLLTGKLNEMAFRQLSHVFADPEQSKSMLDTSRAAIRLAPNLSSKDRELFSNFFDSAQRLTAENSSVKSGGGDAANGATNPMGNFSPAKVNVTELKPKRSSGPTNAYSISFPQGIAWGLMGCVMSFASGLAQERSRGTLLRLAVAPVTRRQVLLGKALSCFIACMMVIVLLMVFGRLVLQVEIADPALFLLAAAVASFGFSGVMMFLAGIFRTEGGAEGAGRAIVLVLAMIGGGTIPLLFMPKFLLTASMISPFRWAIFAVEGAIWRGLTLTQLLPALGALILFGVVGFAVGGWGFARAQAR